MITRTRRLGFTIVELLTAVAIIAMLIALLVPSLSMVRKFAKETRQKAQFAAIGQALMAFRTDYGDYPPSGARGGINEQSPDAYCGAQKLAEALVGRDLLGFNRYSNWEPADNMTSYYPVTEPDLTNSLQFRLGPYLEQDTGNAFKVGQLFFGQTPPIGLNLNRYVLCDAFIVKKVTVGPVGSQKTLKAGMPILYYRAYTARNDWGPAASGANNSRYDYYDNAGLCEAPPLKGELPHLLTEALFYSENYKIVDLQIYEATCDPATGSGGKLWPHRPDSYILISAGADGLYGTSDDITNFGN